MIYGWKMRRKVHTRIKMMGMTMNHLSNRKMIHYGLTDPANILKQGSEVSVIVLAFMQIKHNYALGW